MRMGYEALIRADHVRRAALTEQGRDNDGKTVLFRNCWDLKA